MIERRSTIRLKAEMRVYYGKSPKKALSGFNADLSAGGIYLKTNCPLKVDENLTLTFSIPDQGEETVSCRARVAWVNHEKNKSRPEYPPGAGVQFLDLAPENLASIVSFLEVEATW